MLLILDLFFERNIQSVNCWQNYIKQAMTQQQKGISKGVSINKYIRRLVYG